MQLKKLTKKQKEKLLESRKKARIEKMDKVLGEYLKISIENDLCFNTDPNYIAGRVNTLLQNMREKVNPYSEKILELRQELLLHTMEWAKKNIPKPTKFDAVDATGKQKKRCEPVAIEVLKMILNPGLVKDEMIWSEHAVLEDDIALFATLTTDYAESLLDNYSNSVNIAISNANTSYWGKDFNKRGFKQLSQIVNTCVKPKK